MAQELVKEGKETEPECVKYMLVSLRDDRIRPSIKNLTIRIRLRIRSL
jgi:hypothetical protein